MTIKLTYFNLKGRAELSRMICAYGKLTYEDIRVEFPDWPKLKPTVPYTTLPFLDVDGIRIGQSHAVARYLAKKAGISGKNPIEEALADGIVDFVSDYSNTIPKMRFPSSNEEKCKLATEFLKVKIPQFCKLAEEILSKNGGHYFVGNSLTWADIAVALFSDLVDSTQDTAFAGVPDVDDRFKILAKYPALKKHREMVLNQNGIKEWIKNRPNTPF